MTTDQKLFNEINNQLYVNGKCDKLNQWVFMKVELEGKIAAFEVMMPSRGNIRVRRPLKKMFINDNGQEVWLYNMLKFTNKKELKDEGLFHDIRLDQVDMVAR